MEPFKGVAQGTGLALRLIAEVSAGSGDTVHHALTSWGKSLDLFRYGPQNYFLPHNPLSLTPSGPSSIRVPPLTRARCPALTFPLVSCQKSHLYAVWSPIFCQH